MAHGMLRWLVTVSFVGILIASILHYRSQNFLSSGQVARLTAIDMEVSILLGLDISGALRKMALDIR